MRRGLTGLSPDIFRVYFRRTFAYHDSVMAFGIQERKLFVADCKRCRRDVPAGEKEFPFRSIVVACPLCRDQRQYLPSEVLPGIPIIWWLNKLERGHADMFDPDAEIPRPQRYLIYLGACIIAGFRLARERQVSIPRQPVASRLAS